MGGFGRRLSATRGFAFFGAVDRDTASRNVARKAVVMGWLPLTLTCLGLLVLICLMNAIGVFDD